MHRSNRESFFSSPGGMAALVGLAAIAVAGPGFRCHCSSDSGRILDAHLAAKVDWERHVVEGRASEFSPLVRRFVLVVSYRDMAPDSELHVKWRFLGGKEPKVFRRDLRILEGSGTVLCGARKDQGIWPPGPYEVVVELQGKRVAKVPFSVSSKTSYRFVAVGMDQRPGKGPSRPRLEIPGGGSKLWLNLEALNPKPQTRCRVIWKRRDAKGDFTFYEESESVPIRSSGLIAFELPRPRGGYCTGIYRAEARIEGRKVASLDFELQGAGRPRPVVRKVVGLRSPGEPGPRGAGSPAQAQSGATH